MFTLCAWGRGSGWGFIELVYFRWLNVPAYFFSLKLLLLYLWHLVSCFVSAYCCASESIKYFTRKDIFYKNHSHPTHWKLKTNVYTLNRHPITLDLIAKCRILKIGERYGQTHYSASVVNLQHSVLDVVELSTALDGFSGGSFPEIY